MGSTTPVGIAAVGIGDRLSRILSLLFSVQPEPVRMVAVADDTPEVARAAGQRYECPSYTTLEELLSKHGDAVQWVMIGSKNHLHAQQCICAFRAGKHVFCEKPIAVSMEQLEAIHKAHAASGLKFATGFVLRHARLYVEIQRLIASGAIGRVVSIDANEILYPDHGAYIFRNWRRDQGMSGGHLLEKCCHDIDLLNWYLAFTQFLVSTHTICVFVFLLVKDGRIGAKTRGIIWGS
eukprot:TRINITY_DN1894_c0_g1_i6.p1 TRINITY_DN1894_c0_g1~~TRINITY_DN1894_c0_g1_i6.p1  ORF type:complete len:253 (-),score=33.03 TRINITY_DN1894_c0_g1_i6:411-1118(-)